MNTRKYPRTMQEAFGPYTSSQLQEPDRPFDYQDITVIVASICCAVALVIFAIRGWL